MPALTNAFGASIGELTYNGYTFGSASKIRVESVNVRDESQRTIIYVQHTITAEENISPYDGSPGFPGDASSYMEELRRRLTAEGKMLVLQQKGFAQPWSINTSIVRDVRFGPKPMLIQWEPLGSNLSVRIVWQCVVCLPQCEIGLQRHSGIMAFNYDVSFDIDQHGMTIRTISGYLQIALTRSGKKVFDSADLYWELINVDAPVGYTRQARRGISRDKSRLDFTVVDQQIPTNKAWPVYCTAASGSHRALWSRNGVVVYRNELSLNLTLRKGRPAADAWDLFRRFLSDRMLFALKEGRTVLIQELEAEEDVFGLSHRFRASYTNIGTVNDFLRDNALWKPIGTSWTQWRVSLNDSMFAPRGLSQLSQLPLADAIVDLCPGSEIALPHQDGVFIPDPNEYKGQSLHQPKPPEEKSYYHWGSTIEIEREAGAVRQRTLQPSGDPPAKTDPKTSGFYRGTPVPSDSIADTIIQRGIPSYRITLSGSAVRAGYPVQQPVVTSVGGEDVTEERSEYACSAIANWLGVPIFGARWSIDYLVPKLSGDVYPYQHPAEAIDEEFRVTNEGLPA